MTVSYTARVASTTGFGRFLPLLLRWRGSIYKLVWCDLLVFLSLYFILNLTYRYILDAEQKSLFENVVKYCGNSSLIPLSFVLGFYVSIVMGRWWAQYLAIPWPDSIAVYVSAHIQGNDDRGRLLRRTVMRYVCLCLTMVFTYVSQRVKKRFPTWDYLVEAGLLLENEKVIIDRLDALFPNHPKHWLPIVWSASIIKRARSEGRIRDDFAVKTIIDELNRFRGSAGFVLFYDFISVPLVYTQVVTLAVYSYFIFNIMGSQCIDKPNASGYYDVVEKYFPFFVTLEFFFYMGWLKVAESLINPFGEDDDDFEVNWIIDRNLQVSYLIVDDMHNDHPELVRDQFWDEVYPVELYYSSTSKVKREEPPEPSTAKVGIQINSNADYTQAQSAFNSLGASSRYSIYSKKQKQRNESIISSSTSAESYSMVSKQVGVVAPLNISKPASLTEKSSLTLPEPQAEPVGIIDDFELLRRRREQERLQRNANNLNRTVESLHHAADSSTIIQLAPIRSLVMTDSEASFANVFLSDDQQEMQEENKNITQVRPKAKTRPKVTISEPIKSEDEFEHLRETRAEQRLERRKNLGGKITDSVNKQEAFKPSTLARKAKKDAETASTSKAASQRSNEVGQQTDKEKTSSDKAAGSIKPRLVPSRAAETDFDSEGSISFSDVQGDEKSGDDTDKKQKQKQGTAISVLQRRRTNDSGASTAYSDAEDLLSESEKPERSKDKTADSAGSTMNEDGASESTEQRNWQQAQTDEGTEYYDSPEESTKADSKDKSQPKTQDKSKKKR